MKLIRKNKILLAIVIVLMLSVFSMIPQMAIADEDCPTDAGANSGNNVVPELYTKCAPHYNHNPTCSDLGYSGNAYKIEPVSSGSYNDPNGPLSVTLTVTGNLVKWTSNIPVKAVIVKGGPCANLFDYGSGSKGDTLLHAPVDEPGPPVKYYGLSHIDFCYSEPACPPPGCEIEGDTEICDGSETTLCANEIADATYSWTGPSVSTPDKRCITVSVAGKYTVTIIDECGWSTCSVDLIVNELPDCAITAPDSVCDELTGNIASTISGYESYTWVIANGIITSGQGTNTITFDVTPGVTSVTIVVKVVDSNGCENTCSVTITVDPLPDCSITGDTEICDDETTTLCASDIAGASYSWTGPGVFTSGARCIIVGVAGTYSVTITDECGESTCSVDLIVKHCEKRSCKCSLVVLKRDEDGNPIEDAVFEVDGIEKTTSGGEARWDDLECDTTYEVRELSPIEQTERIHLGDCGERSTLRVVNKIEEGELEVLGIMEVLPFTGPAIPYSPFIGISTVLAGTFLYILSKPKKKR